MWRLLFIFVLGGLQVLWTMNAAAATLQIELSAAATAAHVQFGLEFRNKSASPLCLTVERTEDRPAIELQFVPKWRPGIVVPGKIRDLFVDQAKGRSLRLDPGSSRRLVATLDYADGLQSDIYSVRAVYKAPASTNTKPGCPPPSGKSRSNWQTVVIPSANPKATVRHYLDMLSANGAPQEREAALGWLSVNYLYPGMTLDEFSRTVGIHACTPAGKSFSTCRAGTAQIRVEFSDGRIEKIYPFE